ncbi:GNAT family N-acetyltransferase [Reyranella sp.]|uniref:GNAT family N-acetyltransferase n=1 Tax=Reyranella sp. TaxID=1929291 RepID=UPI003D121F05
MLRLARDPELSRTSSVPAACEASDVAAWISDNNAAPRTSLTFAIIDRGVVAGAVTLKRLDASDNSGELAFWVGQEHRGKGLASKAADLALGYAFNRLLLDYAHAHCLRDSNPASRKTLESLGFTPDKSHSDLPVEGRFAERFDGDAWVFYRLDRPKPVELSQAAIEYQRLWNGYMSSYCGGRTSCFELVEELMRQMLQGEALNVLDVGCGTAAFTARQLLIKSPPRKITAVDGSEKGLLVARQLVASDAPVTFIKGDLTENAWASELTAGSYDVAFLGWVTHEIEPRHLLTLYGNIAQLLRPGGLLFNADFMDGLQGDWRNLGGDYQRRRLGSSFPAFNARFEKLPEVAAAIARDRQAKTRWTVRHAPDAHKRQLFDAGFVDAEEVWRYLGSAMVMAIR